MIPSKIQRRESPQNEYLIMVDKINFSIDYIDLVTALFWSVYKRKQ